jgi:outer membrane receptor protein involved in Fe transport
MPPPSDPFRRRTLAHAISTLLAGGAWQVAAQDGGRIDAIEEVIVTARKRTENLQDIPQSVQAFSSEDIERYGMKGIEDYARFVPSLTQISTSPGQTKLVFRGVAESETPFIADPSAALYLNEQPLTMGSQAPEVRLIDIERIEALSGPQGTLYGASSQSGAMRIITNKPSVEEFEADIGGGTHFAESGGMGHDVDAMVNIPLLNDTVAVRLVGFQARDAGYIDNVLAVTPEQGSRDNAAAVNDNANTVDWIGGRASVKWLVTEDWNTTAIFNYQKSEANGWNDYDPTEGDLETVKFQPEYRDDEWYQASLMIEGDLGFAQLVSATSYLNRGIQYSFDLTFYNAYLNSYAYFDVYNFGPDPTGFNTLAQRDTRWTQETRLSHEGSVWNWTLGVFYQTAREKWDYNIVHDGYRNSVGFQAWQALYGPLTPTDIAWHSQEKSDREDLAVFGEVTYSVTDDIDLIFGGRWYDVTIERVYSQWHPNHFLEDRVTPGGSDSGFLPKGAIQYNFDDDRMIYALYSQGYRTGGINRARGNPTLPKQYDPDKLINYEAGIKTQWLEQRLRVNVTGYHMVWRDFQLEVTDPSFEFGEPFQTVVANVGDAVVDGMDIDVSAVPLPGLELGITASYLFKNETDEPFVVSDPRSPTPVLDLPAGTRLPLTADLSLAAYVDYSWPVALFDAEAYVRFQYSYDGDSLNELVPSAEPFPQLVQKDYHIADVKVGMSMESWDLELYVDNLWDERPEYYREIGNAERVWGRDRIVTGAPRTLGFSIRKHF